MDTLLNFSPEPFADLDRKVNEFESAASEWETNEAEEEVRRRRRPRPLRGTRHGFARTTSVRNSPKARIAPPRLFPAFPFIPPIIGSRPYPLPVPPRDISPPEDNRRTEQPKSEGSGNPPSTQPSGEPGSEYIRWMQDCLNKALGLQLPVDGIMTRETRSAIRIFQERQGLPITGLVGPETKGALKSSCAGVSAPTNHIINPVPEAEWEMQHPSSTPCPSCNRRPTMNYQLSFTPELFARNTEFEELETLGMESFEQWQSETNTNTPQHVRWIQETLNKVLGLNLKIDGIMGSQTRNAIHSFQHMQGLPADGKVGTRTKTALLAARTSTSSLPLSPGIIPAGGLSVSGRQTTPRVVRLPRGPATMKRPQLTHRETEVALCEKNALILNRFDVGDYRLKPYHYEGLVNWGEMLQQLSVPSDVLIIQGHTDVSGTKRMNYGLSLARAFEVYTFLQLLFGGAFPLEARIHAFGETQPVSGDQAQNRRVEIRYCHRPETSPGVVSKQQTRFPLKARN